MSEFTHDASVESGPSINNDTPWGEEYLKGVPPFNPNQILFQADSESAAKPPEIHAVYHDGTSPEDLQIRSGLLTHIEAEPGESIQSVLQKLDYLAENGKPAFIFFNGQRYDNRGYDENGEKVLNTHMLESFERDQQIQEALEEIDNNESIPVEGKFGLIGVLNGAKDATQFQVNATSPKEISQIDDNLSKLGLQHQNNQTSSQFKPDAIDSHYYIAHDKGTIKRVMELVPMSIAEGQAGEATRELGSLFGIPQTAIDFYIDRNKKKNDGIEVPRGAEGYGFYIHSPEHAEEELDEYEGKIMPDFVEQLPNSSTELEDQMSEEQKRSIEKRASDWGKLKQIEEIIDSGPLIGIVNKLPDAESKKEFLEYIMEPYADRLSEKLDLRLEDEFEPTDAQVEAAHRAEDKKNRRSFIDLFRSKNREELREETSKQLNVLIDRLRGGGYISDEDREFIAHHMATGARSRFGRRGESKSERRRQIREMLDTFARAKQLELKAEAEERLGAVQDKLEPWKKDPFHRAKQMELRNAVEERERNARLEGYRQNHPE